MASRLLLAAFLLVAVLTMLRPAGAEEGGANTAEDERQKRDVPNWAMTASDFFGWVEELRKHAGYERIDDLARTFWAHFPSADRLGYGSHEPDE
ncbi:otospiralin-like [Sphaeramia orbicularis]|uniref:otospiralin-like n=1 Tax=Sphaeramia orbicularis TaxID=375764 RepID=UPI001181193B|nr:otospiralin-like [Sphaeramia orbicularis]